MQYGAMGIADLDSLDEVTMGYPCRERWGSRMFCAHCGTRLKDGAAFCTECGTVFRAAPPPVYYGPPPQQSPSMGGSVTQGFGWGCGCLLVPVAIFVVLYVLGSIGQH